MNVNKNDLSKYKKLIETADDFFEAAVRCGFNESDKLKKFPLLIPNFTNRAFACELYLKATLCLTKNKICKGHKLHILFFELSKVDRKGIYNIWRTIDEQNIPDCDYAEIMFCDNLEAISDVFTRFRYVHEWGSERSSISLESSFTEKQMHLHSLNADRLFGSSPVYDGFLDQFAKSIKKYSDELFNQKTY